MERFNTELIINYISERKITINEFCKRCKISHEVFTKILSNKFNFRLNALFKLAKVLNKNVCDLFIDAN